MNSQIRWVECLLLSRAYKYIVRLDRLNVYYQVGHINVLPD